MKKILLVDDEKNVHYSFKKIFSGKYDIISALNGRKAIELFMKDPPDLAIVDIRMEGIDGLDLLSELKRISPKTPVLVITAYGSMEIAIEAMKRGAYDYLVKPFDIPQMLSIVDKAVSSSDGMKEVLMPSEEVEPSKINMVGSSRKIQEIYKIIGKVSQSDVPVLIVGESGTGKELVARAIYTYSPRSDKPFIVINCAAIPDTLLESELFGYEKGAFTGAYERRIGKLEQCDRGTLFLDEIGDMPLSLQSKLLRFLQEGEFTRVGGNKVIKVDVRVIAATNKDLEAEIRRGKFREDLYYRLNVVTIRIPPLRERKEDIPELVHYFIRRSREETGKEIRSITKRAMDKLIDYEWPGNIRELENVIKRAMVMAKGDVISEDDIQIPSEESKEEIDQFLSEIAEKALNYGGRDLLGRIEKALLIKALEKSNWNKSMASRILGISRGTLRSKIRKHKVRGT